METNISFRERRFPSASGVCDIRYRMWIPEDPCAAVQIAHGMAEHIDRYDAFARFLASNGVLVYGMDIAGHGKSVRAGMPLGFFGDENGWDAILQDMRTLHDIAKKEFPALPNILFGHSMGSFIARTYAGRNGEDFEAFVFSGTAGKNPVLPIGMMLAKSEIKKTGGRTPSEKLFKMSFGAYNKAFKPNRTENDWLSRDTEQVDCYVADPLCGFPFTSSAMLEVFKGLGEVSSAKWASRVPKRPILLMSGAMDPVGGMGKGVRQVAGWLEKTGHSVEMKLYEGGRHEMLNETNRADVYNDVLLFIETVMAEGELK